MKIPQWWCSAVNLLLSVLLPIYVITYWIHGLLGYFILWLKLLQLFASLRNAPPVLSPRRRNISFNHWQKQRLFISEAICKVSQVSHRRLIPRWAIVLTPLVLLFLDHHIQLAHPSFLYAALKLFVKRAVRRPRRYFEQQVSLHTRITVLVVLPLHHLVDVVVLQVLVVREQEVSGLLVAVDQVLLDDLEVLILILGWLVLARVLLPALPPAEAQCVHGVAVLPLVLLENLD